MFSVCLLLVSYFCMFFGSLLVSLILSVSVVFCCLGPGLVCLVVCVVLFGVCFLVICCDHEV